MPKQSDPIHASMACTAERLSGLFKVLDSILHQVDSMYLVLNGVENIPSWLSNYNVDVVCNTQNQGAIQKFSNLRFGWNLICDDDFIYPKNYVRRLKQSAQKYPREILCYHGVTFRDTGATSYFHDRAHAYPWSRRLWRSKVVDVGGTGLMFFHSEFFDPEFTDLSYKNMVDLYIAIQARDQGLKIRVLPHSGSYFESLNYKDSIYAKAKLNDEIYTQRLNEKLLKI